MRYGRFAGASATYTFTGSSIAWVASRGPDRGSAKVYVDGVYAKTVSLYTSGRSYRYVAFARNFGATGSHTIRIVVEGTPRPFARRRRRVPAAGDQLAAGPAPVPRRRGVRRRIGALRHGLARSARVLPIASARTTSTGRDASRCRIAARWSPVIPGFDRFRACRASASIWPTTRARSGGRRSSRPAPRTRRSRSGPSPGRAGSRLARYVLEHPDEVRGRRVLDFATGSGLVAIAAARAGAAEVIAADIDPFAEVAFALNCRANDVAVDFVREDLLDEPPPDVDVLLAADTWYEGPLAERVMPWLAGGRRAGGPGPRRRSRAGATCRRPASRRSRPTRSRRRPRSRTAPSCVRACSRSDPAWAVAPLEGARHEERGGSVDPPRSALRWRTAAQAYRYEARSRSSGSTCIFSW